MVDDNHESKVQFKVAFNAVLMVPPFFFRTQMMVTEEKEKAKDKKMLLEKTKLMEIVKACRVS